MASRDHAPTTCAASADESAWLALCVEERAKELHALSCEARGRECHWWGRRTNRAYYRRLAMAEVAPEEASPRGASHDD